MDKVHSLHSTKSSYPIARQRPKSLKYYLDAGLHHRIVGRFAVVSFFSRDNNPRNINSNEDKPQARNSKQNITKMNKPPSRENSAKSPADRSRLRDKEGEEKAATGATYSSASDPGPFANYEKTRNDPALVREKVRLSKEVLATARTVFPIDPFPDTVVLDRTTLSITKRTFFLSNDTLSIRIEDILNAHVNVGPFLGSLTIASRILSSEDHFTISNLKRKDAIHLKHMIQGYIIALHNEIDISHMNKEELIETISELGHDLNS